MNKTTTNELPWRQISVLVLLLSGMALGQQEIFINQVLDSPLTLVIKDKPLGEVFETISAKTGVPLRVSERAWGCLPYGRKTRASAAFRNITLRKGLKKMLAPLAFTFQVGSNGVEIRPLPPMCRIGRRATWQELALLAELYRARVGTKLSAGGPFFQFKLPLGRDTAAARKSLDADLGPLVKAGRISWADALTRITRKRNLTWTLWGDEVLLIDRRLQIARQLDARVSVRYSRAPLRNILLELAEKADVPLSFEPGVLARLPAEVRQAFTLYLTRASVRQAFEAIAAETGLRYEIWPKDVYWSAADSKTPARRRRRSRDPFVAKVGLPGLTHVEVMLRESDLTPELRRLIEKRKRQAIKRLERKLKSKP